MAAIWRSEEESAQNMQLEERMRPLTRVARIISGLSIIFVFGISVFGGCASYGQEKPKFLHEQYKLHFEGKSKSWGKVIEFIGSDEFKTFATLVGAYYGVSPEVVDQITGAVNTIAPSGQINEGEDHRGVFAAPDGYTVCRVDWDMSAEFDPGLSDTIFNLRYGRTCQPPAEDNVGYHIVTPDKAWGDPTSVTATLGITYVLADPPEVVRLTQAGICQPHNRCAALCKNGDCKENVDSCVPEDKRVDRWLGGHGKSCENDK
jgi:hypothetical protein